MGGWRTSARRSAPRPSPQPIDTFRRLPDLPLDDVTIYTVVYPVLGQDSRVEIATARR